jgi:hypothetical protein
LGAGELVDRLAGQGQEEYVEGRVLSAESKYSGDWEWQVWEHMTEQTMLEENQLH